MNWRNLKIRVCGSKKNIAQTEQLLDTIDLTGIEHKDRLILQDFIDENNIKTAILYDGNTIVSYDRIITEYKKILKKGKFDKMSNYFYEFLHLDAGSIAHYSKQGWFSEYDSLEKLKSFFLHNENGVSIINEPPAWQTDVIRIAKTIMELTTSKKPIIDIKPNGKKKSKQISVTKNVEQLDLFSLIA